MHLSQASKKKKKERKMPGMVNTKYFCGMKISISKISHQISAFLNNCDGCLFFSAYVTQRRFWFYLNWLIFVTIIFRTTKSRIYWTIVCLWYLVICQVSRNHCHIYPRYTSIQIRALSELQVQLLWTCKIPGNLSVIFKLLF